MTVINNNIKTVILHVPKTGGSSVRWPAIRKYGLVWACQHGFIKNLPKVYTKNRKVTFVRNPYDWYVSRYAFDMHNLKKHGKHKKENIFTIALSDYGRLSFKETLPFYQNLTETFQKHPKKLDEFKSLLKHRINNLYYCWLSTYFDNIEEITPEDFHNLSLYEWYCVNQGVLNENVIKYRIEDQYSEGMRKEFGDDIELMHKNKSSHKPPREVYTQSMKDMVFDHNKRLFQLFKYDKNEFGKEKQ